MFWWGLLLGFILGGESRKETGEKSSSQLSQYGNQMLSQGYQSQQWMNQGRQQ